jgi:hypothetical protein
MKCGCGAELVGAGLTGRFLKCPLCGHVESFNMAVAKSVFQVQPMTMPSGGIFYQNFDINFEGPIDINELFYKKR